MEIKDITIKDFSLNIKVVEINNKKLTKSLFDQLPEYFPFNKNVEFIGDKIFGFIKIKNVKQSNDFLLFIKGNKVYKSNLTFLKNLSNISLYSQYHDNKNLTKFIFFGKKIETFIDDSHLDHGIFKELYSMNYRTELVFNENGRNLIQDTMKNASKFLNDINDLQIFI